MPRNEADKLGVCPQLAKFHLSVARFDPMAKSHHREVTPKLNSISPFHLEVTPQLNSPRFLLCFPVPGNSKQGHMIAD